MPTVHARLRRTALACAVATLAPASIASAGTPFTIGTTSSGNDQYSIALNDGTGTAHIVFKSSVASDVVYCKVPRGAAACASTTTLSMDTDPSPGFVQGPEHPWIIRNPGSGELQILDSRYVAGDVRAWRSVDDGATWTPGTGSPALELSEDNPGTDPRRPVLLNGGFALMPSFNAGGLQIDRFALNGSEGTSETSAVLPPGSVANLEYDLMAASTTGTQLVATAASLASTYSWTLADQANADTVGSWSAAPTLVAENESSPQLISTAGQTYLFTSTNPSNVPRVRKWTGSGFGPATSINLAGNIYRADSAEGGAHSAVVATGATQIRAAVSGDGGATYVPRVVANEAGVFPDIAVDDSGQGFAIWKGDGNAMRVANLTDVAPPPAATPTPGPTPVPTPPPGGGTIFVPGGSPGVPTTQTGSGSGGTYTVTGPKTCVPRGGKFSVTLKVRKQKKKGNVFVKVTKVDFSIDGRIKKTDKKAPFRQTLVATATAAKGSTITMRARAFIKMRKTKRIPKKSIFLRIRICS